MNALTRVEALQPFNPEVGDRVTYCIGSDRYASTVVKRTKCRVTTRSDRVRQVGQYHGDQRWIAVVDPNGRMDEFTLRPDGIWRPKGRACGYLVQGSHHHQDPSF